MVTYSFFLSDSFHLSFRFTFSYPIPYARRRINGFLPSLFWLGLASGKHHQRSEEEGERHEDIYALACSLKELCPSIKGLSPSQVALVIYASISRTHLSPDPSTHRFKALEWYREPRCYQLWDTTLSLVILLRHAHTF